MNRTHRRLWKNIRICDFTGQLAGAGASPRRFLEPEIIRVEDPVNKGKWDILRAYRRGLMRLEAWKPAAPSTLTTTPET